jgi:asparagine synthase (glutamine-hydrolysing)
LEEFANDRRNTMCGIAGIIGSTDKNVANRMVRAIAHRGPDGIGELAGPWFAASMVRLSIVDELGGAQPVFDSDRRVAVLFNGEIFNHRELRRSLEGRGRVFRTDCDTEVILQLYCEEGLAAIAKLEGMFAIAIFDGDEIHLCRDVFGIKPLYLRSLDNGGALLFASEIKALTASSLFSPRINWQAAVDDMVQGYPAAGATFLEGVEQLPPGSILTVRRRDDGSLALSNARFASARFEPADEPDFAANVERLRDALLQAVSRQTECTAALGFALSGGLDSTTLAVLASGRAPVRGVCVSDGSVSPDLEVARMISRHHAVTLIERHVNFDEYIGALADAVWIEERISHFSAVPCLFVAQEAAKNVRVMVSGEGADELFGGYLSYAGNPKGAQERLREINRLIADGIVPHPSVVQDFQVLARADSAESHTRMVFDRSLHDQLVCNHLELADKYFMAFGIECRVPYLDRISTDVALTLPQDHRVNQRHGVQKMALKAAAASLSPVACLAALRMKVGLPGALGAFHRMLGRPPFSEYRSAYAREFGAVLPFRGMSALALDLFIHIHILQRSSRPAPGLVAELLREGLSGRNRSEATRADLALVGT